MQATQTEGGFGLYVHWPFCLSKCPYCDFNSHVRGKTEDAAWCDALCTELERLAVRIEDKPQLDTIFFGGGTPSLMPPKTVAAIIEHAGKLFPFADDIEITLEANPTSSEAARFAGFRATGVNRLSLGVQSLEDQALQFLGRKHSASEARRAIELARANFPRLSFDLIYARPNQTPGAWRAELEQAIALAADHLSLYQLTIEPQTGFGALAALGKLPTLPDEEAAELYFLTQEVMEDAGLPAYEISNHAKAGAESRHNLIYWRSGAWIGIGPGAHGRLPAQDGGRIATESEKLPEKWLSLVREGGAGLVSDIEVAASDQAKEILLMGLRLAEGVALDRVDQLDATLLDHQQITELSEQGFLVRNANRLVATTTGRPVLNRLIAEITNA
ncbi:MAG: radical SAM family heme chaperone HemW [Alphaproteobacteria bacterium]